MSLRDILVHLDGTERAKVRLGLAAELARRHDAHLTALNVIDSTLPAIIAGEASGAAVLADLLEEMRQDALAAAAKMEAALRERLRLDGIAGEWRQVEGIASAHMALHARYADLVVVGQEDPEVDAPAAGAVIGQALFTSGRPVLVVPPPGASRTSAEGCSSGRTRAARRHAPSTMRCR